MSQPPRELSARYDVGGVLGRGGMGVVYRAVERDGRRPVAIKVLAGDDLHREDRLRFEQEGRVAARLAHANLVQVIEAGLHGEVPFIVYELVEGGSLRDVLRYEPVLAPVRALGLVAQIAEGVGAAHAAGLVHRDLKPENVLLAPGDVAKVTDFGVAKLTDGSGMKTRTGILLGTPSYMAPEQVREEPLTGSVDVYALGVMLHEMLSGAVPFTGKPMDVLVAHIEKAPPPLPSRVPAGVVQLVERMLAKVPAERPAGMEAVAAEARRLIEDEHRMGRGKSGPASRAGKPSSTPASQTMVVRPPAAAPPEDGSPASGTLALERPGARVPPLALAAAIGALALAFTVHAWRARIAPGVTAVASAAPVPSPSALPEPPPDEPPAARPARRRMPRPLGWNSALTGPVEPGLPGDDVPPAPGLPPRRPPAPAEAGESFAWPPTPAEQRLIAHHGGLLQVFTPPSRQMLAARIAALRRDGAPPEVVLQAADRLLLWTMFDSTRRRVEEIHTGELWVDRIANQTAVLMRGSELEAQHAHRHLDYAGSIYDVPEAAHHAPRFLQHVARLLSVRMPRQVDDEVARRALQEVQEFADALSPDEPWHHGAVLVACTLGPALRQDVPVRFQEARARGPRSQVAAAVFETLARKIEIHLELVKQAR